MTVKKRKRLLKSQKELLIQWIAEGLLTDEINKRAAKAAEPFHVSRQQVDYYRKGCAQGIQELQAQAKFKAMNEGLALKDVRVDKLKQMGEMVEKMIIDAQARGKFSKPLMDSYRGLLDDIAKELGDRSIKTDITTDQDGEFRITFKSEVESDGA